MQIDIIFFIAEIFLIFSYLCRKILLLRIGAALGMGTYALGAFIAGLPEKGMITIFVFGVITVFINVYEIIRIAKETKPIQLPENLKEIYNNYFNSLTQKEFLKVYQNLEIKNFPKGEILSVENEMIKNIYFINSGIVNIIKDNKIVSRCSEIDLFKKNAHCIAQIPHFHIYAA